ncbi:MAG: hypothetical protein GX651_00635 [Methanomicrobiales archaeon]|nr:hypothetical protein [Methanomicrobiales archaeon]
MSPAEMVTGSPAPASTPQVIESPTAWVAETATTTIVPESTRPVTPVQYQTLHPVEVTSTVPTRVASDNPYLVNLNIRKRTFDYPLPNCFMQVAFPGLLKDTYGIQQVVPNLAVVSEDEYLTFIRKNTEDNSEKSKLKTPSACFGSAAEPTWNFIEVRVILDPSNVHPADYTITENIVSDGKVVVKFATTRSLVIGNQVTLLSYIPIRSDDVDLFDTVAITYTRH